MQPFFSPPEHPIEDIPSICRRRKVLNASAFLCSSFLPATGRPIVIPQHRLAFPFDAMPYLFGTPPLGVAPIALCYRAGAPLPQEGRAGPVPRGAAYVRVAPGCQLWPGHPLNKRRWSNQGAEPKNTSAH